MFQTLKEVERHLHLVERLDHLAGDKAVRQEFFFICLMQCLCTPKRSENNTVRKDPDSGSSLDGSFFGNGISWLCIASTEYNA